MTNCNKKLREKCERVTRSYESRLREGELHRECQKEKKKSKNLLKFKQNELQTREKGAKEARERLLKALEQTEMIIKNIETEKTELNTKMAQNENYTIEKDIDI